MMLLVTLGTDIKAMTVLLTLGQKHNMGDGNKNTRGYNDTITSTTGTTKKY